MKDFVKTVLANPEHPVTKDLLSSSLALLKTSKDYVTTLYPQWDVSDLDFRLQRSADDADKKAERRKEPKKVVLPFAHSQVLTFVAFCILLYNQRPNFFEVSGTGPEDNGTPESDAQKVLTRDLKASKFNSVLYQILLDLGRWGLCVAKTSWEVKQATVLTEAMQPAGGNQAADNLHGYQDHADLTLSLLLGCLLPADSVSGGRVLCVGG